MISKFEAKLTKFCIQNGIYLFILDNLDHTLGVVSPTRVSGGNRTHDPHANSLAHYPLDYQGTQLKLNFGLILQEILKISESIILKFTHVV